MDSLPKPDVIINYNFSPDNLNPVFIASVRPESNEIPYEKVILLGIKDFADVVYLANLNGKILLQNSVVFDHYSSQFKFAVYGGKEIAMYPEMVERFEQYFGVKFDNAPFLGSFDAVIRLNKTPEQLFDTIVDEKDFMYMYGQTIKKIDGYYVINANLPSIINRYTADINMFVVAARCRSNFCDFDAISRSIYDMVKGGSRTPLIDEHILQNLDWGKRIKRTFHLSNNYINAMFDMIDYIFHPDNTRITFAETPLGLTAMQRYGISEQDLVNLKNAPLVYVVDELGRKNLVDLEEYAQGKSFDQCIELLGRVIY